MLRCLEGQPYSLYYDNFLKGTWASADFGICRDSQKGDQVGSFDPAKLKWSSYCYSIASVLWSKVSETGEDIGLCLS